MVKAFVGVVCTLRSRLLPLHPPALARRGALGLRWVQLDTQPANAVRQSTQQQRDRNQASQSGCAEASCSSIGSQCRAISRKSSTFTSSWGTASITQSYSITSSKINLQQARSAMCHGAVPKRPADSLSSSNHRSKEEPLEVMFQQHMTYILYPRRSWTLLSRGRPDPPK